MTNITTLTKQYQTWLKANKLPKLSADELYNEVDDDDEYICNSTQRTWLYNFMKKFEKASN